jgi:non-reducing end alpha-L-arabinofuranosidase
LNSVESGIPKSTSLEDFMQFFRNPIVHVVLELGKKTPGLGAREAEAAAATGDFGGFKGNGRIGFVGAVVLASTIAANGCTSVSSNAGTPAGNGGSATGSSTGNGGSPGNGGNNQTTSPGGNCSGMTPCGGNIVGTWNVTSSCLRLAGNMDVSLAGLGCATVPLTSGSLQVNGTWTANGDGSYTDNTTTTGAVTFPLASSCLTISSVPVTCEKAGTIFAALGWVATCSSAGGQCNCSANANQKGGIGLVSVYASASGRYSTSGNVLTTDEPTTNSYCVSGNTLTITPQTTGVTLTGTVVLQKDVTSTGTGGAPGSGGQSSAGGKTAAGGAAPRGGATSTGGTTSAGGTTSTGGTTGVGGVGGVTAAGGKGGAGGTTPAGGTSSVGGTAIAGGKGGVGGTTTPGGTSGAGGTTTPGGSGSTTGPCDIYAAASATCVAAHSTIRALFGSYSGDLYQVRRTDGTKKEIPVLSPGGFADSSVQDSFCSGSTCVITLVYDQSGHGNVVEAEEPTSTVGGYTGQTAAKATAESLTVSGHKVYSLYTTARQAYWRDGSKTGMPLGASPQGVYMVTSGTHFNNGCCYDYGNGETSRTYVAGPTMDAVAFMGNTNGSPPPWGTGAGSGPWVMADLEGGVFSGATTGNNPNNPSQTAKYVTAMEKNNGTTAFALRGGDATAGTLGTYYSGALPAGKNPMKKQGSIILGSGGDCCYSNNNASQGTFYEGAIVAGYPSDATDAAIQANIVSAQYGK